jgi:Flp pilus assembly protein TadG
MLARFLTNTRGGVVPLMAVVAVPLMASVGIAVDYSRINAARTAFQVALDATALMMSKNAATETDAQRQTEATNTFNSLFSRPEVTDIAISPNFASTGGSKLTLNGTAVVHTNFLGIIGVSKVDINALSVSTWGNTRLRVALALDHGQRWQNGCSQDRISQFADAVEKRRRSCGRRLCLDCPLQQGRKLRPG